MLPKPDSTLVVVGHGSTLNPDSSQPTHQHVETIRQRGLFGEVVCAFWKEEPFLREVLRMVDSRDVYVVPNFISEGYFTTEVIPRELQLTGRTTEFSRHAVHYCDPVGLHPSMTKLLLKRAAEVAPGVPRAETSLVIVGHGTGLNENSAKAIRDQAALIRSMDCGFAEVLDAYMEEPPLIADWVSLTSAPNVIVVPFFIADGLHSWQDIPVLLGIEKEPSAAASRMDVFRQNPRLLHGRRLFFTSAIGTEPMLADVILDQVAAFDEKYRSPTVSCQLPPFQTRSAPSLLTELKNWLEAGGSRLGEVVILRGVDGALHIRHHLDADVAGLSHHATAEAARHIAQYDAAGEFRPLKSAPSLIRGWEISLPDVQSLLRALDFFYPAAFANWVRWLGGEASVPTLREMLGRQSGIYRVTALLNDDEASQLVAGLCRDKCLRRVMWSLDGSGPWRVLSPEKQSAGPDAPSSGCAIPLLCFDACPLFIGGARKAVRRRMKEKPEAVLPEGP